MKAPIASRKHYVQFTEFTTASAAVTNHIYALGQAVQNVNLAAEVVEGEIVKSIFLEYWVIGNGATPGSFVAIVEKSVAGQAAPTFSEMSTLDAYPNKKNILYTTQGLVSDDTANPTPLMRNWIKIPKGKQRIGLDDQIRVTLAALGASGLTGCAFGTYKSFS